MNKLESVLNHAGQQCETNGTRLTPKRKAILRELLKSGKALSAYEITDLLNKQSMTAIPTMSVYRILDFLQDENLVHKLNLANKYVACAHISCNHAHAIPQFLICRQCTKVVEISIDKSTIGEIKRKVEHANFKLTKPQLEMHCICNDCD